MIDCRARTGTGRERGGRGEGEGDKSRSTHLVAEENEEDVERGVVTREESELNIITSWWFLRTIMICPTPHFFFLCFSLENRKTPEESEEIIQRDPRESSQKGLITLRSLSFPDNIHCKHIILCFSNILLHSKHNLNQSSTIHIFAFINELILMRID